MSDAVRKYDLFGPDFKRDPYPTFSAMRRDDPIDQQPGLDGRTPIWFVTRYDDAEAMLRDLVSLSYRFLPGFRALESLPVRWDVAG